MIPNENMRAASFIFITVWLWKIVQDSDNKNNSQHSQTEFSQCPSARNQNVWEG